MKPPKTKAPLKLDHRLSQRANWHRFLRLPTSSEEATQLAEIECRAKFNAGKEWQLFFKGNLEGL